MRLCISRNASQMNIPLCVYNYNQARPVCILALIVLHRYTLTLYSATAFMELPRGFEPPPC